MDMTGEGDRGQYFILKIMERQRKGLGRLNKQNNNFHGFENKPFQKRNYFSFPFSVSKVCIDFKIDSLIQ